MNTTQQISFTPNITCNTYAAALQVVPGSITGLTYPIPANTIQYASTSLPTQDDVLAGLWLTWPFVITDTSEIYAGNAVNGTCFWGIRLTNDTSNYYIPQWDVNCPNIPSI